MSSHIQEELKGSGVARVIVVLKEGREAAAAPDPEPILRHFVASEYSQVSAMAAAGRARGAAGVSGSVAPLATPSSSILP